MTRTTFEMTQGTGTGRGILRRVEERTTMLGTVLPLLLDQRVHAVVAVLAALAAGLLLGPDAALARPKGPG